jgi:peptidoglycan hydrolase CwlO-like protein
MVKWGRSRHWQLAVLAGIFAGLFCLVFSPLEIARRVSAAECECKPDEEEDSCLATKQSCWRQKIEQAQAQANTLSSILQVLNSQIGLQESQIAQTQSEIKKLEKEIGLLTQQIEGLNGSLDDLTAGLIENVQTDYKSRSNSGLTTLAFSKSFQDFYNSLSLLKRVQQQTQEMIQTTDIKKTTLDEQKAQKEIKQAEVNAKKQQLEVQRREIANQRAGQQALLAQTQNDEKRYQEELAKTLAEKDAIQSIVSGYGNETKVRDVEEGDKIASVIQGASPCSTGTHLHLEVVKDNTHQNPAGYLKEIPAQWNNSPDGAFGFGGDWNWPLNDPAKINQGYGMTWYARVRRSYGGAPHTGIDMNSKNGDSTVKAVKSGTLYQGGIKCGKGTLKYVKVQHKDSNLSTFYLHVNF